MRRFEDALARLCEPTAEVSAHYVIDRDGTCVQIVAEDMRAWHAGAGAWCGLDDINSRSIGIELVNTGAEPFPTPQMRALETLLPEIMGHWGIAPVDVIAHSDMAPERKHDPGPRFDWRALARTGTAFWPEGYGATTDFDTALTQIGYPPAPSAARLSAFRARFRPEGRGPLSELDVQRAERVAQAIKLARMSG